MQTKFGLKAVDFNKWVNNTVDFLAPVGLIYFSYVAIQIELDGFSLQDFVPSNFVLGSMTLYVVNIVKDFLNKRNKSK